MFTIVHKMPIHLAPVAAAGSDRSCVVARGKATCPRPWTKRKLGVATG
jgi:hypothetical protein